MIVSNEIRTNIDSYLDFWRMSGVDYTFDDAAMDWFEHSKQAVNVQIAPPQSNKDSTKINEKSNHEPDATKTYLIAKNKWPDTLDALHQQIAAGVAFPGNTYGRKIAQQSGKTSPALMVLGDVPEIDDTELGGLEKGRCGQMAAALGRAISINHDEIYYSALATTRPGSGALPDEQRSELLAFALHCISIIQPKVLLIFGPYAGQMILNADFMAVRGRLLNVNHKGGNVAALTTFHPRTLLTNSTLKSVVWQDLQMLAKRVHSEE